ncbi:transposase, partial [candidate division KSB1 bacterium]|nr:transposase [candidate division KSB1 bacterium]
MFMGGQLGFFGVLQTWARDLAYHPHLHFIVAGGGLSPDGTTWLPVRGKFLVPVKALSKIFRAKFRDALKKQKPELFRQVPPGTWKKDWVVDCRPVGSGERALKYLAPYIFRVAISNRRLLKLENGNVTFQYRDGETKRFRTKTVAAEEFIRRFLQHVLPHRFIKVRYYGFLSSSHRKRLEKVKELLHVKPVATEPT